jgi:hypothetical protein
MSGVFQNIDPPPPLRPAFGAGGGNIARGRGGWGPIVRKTPDTALYSVYVSTLWARLFLIPVFSFVLSRSKACLYTVPVHTTYIKLQLCKIKNSVPWSGGQCYVLLARRRKKAC